MALNLGQIFYQLGVDTAGLNKADSRVKSFQRTTTKSFDNVNRAANRLKQTLGFLISVETLRRTALMADRYGLLKDRVRSVVGEVNKANIIFKRLEDISGKTGATLNTIAGGFQKLQFSRKTVRGTTEEMIRLTQSFSELGLISGTAPALLDAAMLQFSQGLVTGTFQAQEFQSVLENVPAIAGEIAAGMGITVEELIKLKKEGRLISEDVFRALVDRADEISKKAAEMPIRLSRGFARFTLGIQQALGGLDEANGLTLKLGRSFFEAGEKLRELPIAIEAISKTLEGLNEEGGKLESLIRSLTVVTGGMIAFSVATKVAGIALRAITKANIFIAIAVAIGIIIDQTIGLNKTFLLMAAILKGVFLAGKTGFKDLGNVVFDFSDAVNKALNFDFKGARGSLNKIKASFGLAAVDIVKIAKDASDEVEGIFTKTGGGEEGLFSGLFDFDIGNLDLVKSFQENLLALQIEAKAEEERLLREAALTNEKIEGDSLLKRLRIHQFFADTKRRFILDANKKEIDDARTGFRQQIELAGESSREFAAVTKALALFDLLVKTPQAIGDAFTFGNSIGGPALGGALAAVAGAAMATQVAAVQSQSFTPRNVGGDVFPNQIYRVNENGPELFNFGGKDFLSTGASRGTIAGAGKFSSGNGQQMAMPNVNVNVFPVEGQTATVQQSTDRDGNLTFDVIMEQLDAAIADGIESGASQVSRVLSQNFGVNRVVGAIA